MGDMASTARLAASYVAHRLDRGEIRAETGRLHRQVLRGFAAVAPVAHKITKRHITRWSRLQAHCSPGTRRVRWSIVKGFLAHLRRKAHLTRDPMADFEGPKVPKAVHRALSDEQADLIYEAATDTRDRLIVSLGLQLGLRRGEIARLEVGSFSPDLSTVVVSGKGGHERRLPTTEAVRVDVRAYQLVHGVASGHLIRGDRWPERPVTPDWVGRQFARVAYSAGVKCRPFDGVSPHAMRHHAATAVYQRTGDVLKVRDMLGHSSLQTTDVYVQGMDVEGLRDAMEGRQYGRRDPEAA